MENLCVEEMYHLCFGIVNDDLSAEDTKKQMYKILQQYRTLVEEQAYLSFQKKAKIALEKAIDSI